MMKKLAILLCLLLLVPALVIPGAAAGSTPPAYLCPQPPDGSELAYQFAYKEYVEEGVFESGLYVYFKNCGPSAVDNVKATIDTWPSSVTVLDGVVEFGNLGVGEGRWSNPDLFVIRVITPSDVDPHLGITWKVEYDVDGVHYEITGVPQECECEPSIPGGYEPGPLPPLSMNIKHMTIKWANDGVSWSRWSCLNKDIFTIWGRLNLPDGYTRADVLKQATVSIAIGGSSGSDTVELQKKYLRWLRGELWAYRGNESPGGINITNMVIWWAPDGCSDAGRAGFYVRGVLDLDSVGVNTQLPEATVALEIPVVDDDSLIGDETITFRVYQRLNLWSYYAWPSLPCFHYDPSGTE